MTYKPYDLIIAEASSAASEGATTVQLTNNTGTILNLLNPVTLDSAGDMKLINVSIEADALSTVGVLKETTLNTLKGKVVRIGKIENVNSLGFALRDAIYVSKTGGLTNTPPTTGVNGFVSGDFVIRLGKIAKNQTNTLQKDFLIEVTIIGQLA